MAQLTREKEQLEKALAKANAKTETVQAKLDAEKVAHAETKATASTKQSELSKENRQLVKDVKDAKQREEKLQKELDKTSAAMDKLKEQAAATSAQPTPRTPRTGAAAGASSGDADVAALQKQLAALEKEKQKLQEALDKAKQQAQEATQQRKEELKSHQTATKEKEKAVKAAEADLQKLAKEVERLGKVVEGKDKEIERLHAAAIMGSSTTSSAAQPAVVSPVVRSPRSARVAFELPLDETSKQLQIELNEAQQKLAQVERERAAAAGKITTLQKQLREGEEKTRKVEEECRVTRAKLEEAERDAVAQSDAHHAQVRQMQATLHESEVQLTALRNEITSLKASLADQEQKAVAEVDIEASLGTLRTRITLLEKDLHATQEEAVSAHKSLLTTQEALCLAEDMRNGLNEKLHNTSLELRAARQEAQEAATRAQRAEEEVQQLNMLLQAKAEDEQENGSAQEGKLREMEERVARLQDALDCAEEEKEKLMHSVSRRSDSLAQQLTEIQEERDAALCELTEQAERQHQQLLAAQQELQATKSEVQRRETEIASLSVDLRTAKERLESTRRQLEDALASLKSNKSYETRYRDLERASREHSTASEATADALQRENAQLRKANEALRQQLDQPVGGRTGATVDRDLSSALDGAAHAPVSVPAMKAELAAEREIRRRLEAELSTARARGSGADDRDGADVHGLSPTAASAKRNLRPPSRTSGVDASEYTSREQRKGVSPQQRHYDHHHHSHHEPEPELTTTPRQHHHAHRARALRSPHRLDRRGEGHVSAAGPRSSSLAHRHGSRSPAPEEVYVDPHSQSLSCSAMRMSSVSFNATRSESPRYRLAPSVFCPSSPRDLVFASTAGRLLLSHHGRRLQRLLFQPGSPTSMANAASTASSSDAVVSASALGSLSHTIYTARAEAAASAGYDAGDRNLFRYTVRLGPQCEDVLVGFADRSVPLEGYGEVRASLRYPGCYYLHLGEGSLYSPGQGIRGVLYRGWSQAAPQAAGNRDQTMAADGEAAEYSLQRGSHTSHEGTQTGLVATAPWDEVSCVLNLRKRTISFEWNGVDCGVAFSGVNVTRSLYPSVQFDAGGGSVEIV